MAVARVTEISATSPKGFDDAIQQGVTRATKTLPERPQRMGQGTAGRHQGRPDRRLPGKPDGDVRPRRLTRARGSAQRPTTRWLMETILPCSHLSRCLPGFISKFTLLTELGIPCQTRGRARRTNHDVR